MIRVVDNKKLDMTDDEFALYNKIVQSYTTTTNKGEDMFIDLFETDKSGFITFLKPPSKRQTSLEVFLFLVSIMTHQQLRFIQTEFNDLAKQIKTRLNELDNKIKEIK